METRKNTLRLAFASSAKVPAHLDVLKFMMKVLKVPATDVHSVYKDENDQKFYVKFIDDTSFNRFTSSMDEQYVFQYGDGEKTRIQLELASRQFKYIRIFNLPPETDDKDIAAVLGQFGRIRQHVRERYPAEYGYHVFSGIRGVHMEIEKEIPANLYIGHFRARLFYEGLKNKCFFCKAEGHIKAECPKLASLRENPHESHLYSRVTANLKVATTSGSLMNAPSSSMTVLQVSNNRGESGAEVAGANATNNRKELMPLANKVGASNDQRVLEKAVFATPTIIPEGQRDTATSTSITEANNGTQQTAMIIDDDGDARKEGTQQLKRPPGTTTSETDTSDAESSKKGRGRKKKQHVEQTPSLREKMSTRSSSKP